MTETDRNRLGIHVAIQLYSHAARAIATPSLPTKAIARAFAKGYHLAIAVWMFNERTGIHRE